MNIEEQYLILTELEEKHLDTKQKEATIAALVTARSKLLEMLRATDASNVVIPQAEYQRYCVKSRWVEPYFEPSEDLGGAGTYRGGCTEYNVKSEACTLKLRDLGEGQLVSDILDALQRQQKIAQYLPEYKEKRALVTADDLSSFVAFNDFLKATGFQEKDLKDFRPVDAAEIIKTATEKYLEGKASVAEKKANIELAASVPLFAQAKEVRDAKMAILEKLERDFSLDNRRPSHGVDAGLIDGYRDMGIFTADGVAQIASKRAKVASGVEAIHKLGKDLPKQVNGGITNVARLAQVRGNREVWLVAQRARKSWKETMHGEEGQGSAIEL